MNQNAKPVNEASSPCSEQCGKEAIQMCADGTNGKLRIVKPGDGPREWGRERARTLRGIFPYRKEHFLSVKSKFQFSQIMNYQPSTYNFLYRVIAWFRRQLGDSNE